MLSLAVTSDKPSIVNYRYVPGGLWLEDVHTLPEKKVFLTRLCVYANGHPPHVLFSFLLWISDRSPQSPNAITIFPARIQNGPLALQSGGNILLSPLLGHGSVHASSSLSGENWGRVYTLLTPCLSAQVFYLSCCHQIQWCLKWHKETTSFAVTVVSGSGRAILP